MTIVRCGLMFAGACAVREPAAVDVFELDLRNETKSTHGEKKTAVDSVYEQDSVNCSTRRVALLVNCYIVTPIKSQFNTVCQSNAASNRSPEKPAPSS